MINVSPIGRNATYASSDHASLCALLNSIAPLVHRYEERLAFLAYDKVRTPTKWLLQSCPSVQYLASQCF